MARHLYLENKDVYNEVPLIWYSTIQYATKVKDQGDAEHHQGWEWEENTIESHIASITMHSYIDYLA